MFDPVRPPLTGPSMASLAAKLSAMATEIADLARPAETTFLALGDVLLASVQVLQGIERDFGALIGLLTSPDADTAGQSLAEVANRAATLAGRSSRISDGLGRMETATGAALRPLADLGKIAGEIGALGVNARIQAAQIGAAGIDFSVFTTQILSLRTNTEQAIDAAATRFHGVRTMVDAVRTIETELRTTDIRDIQTTKERFATGVGTLAERRRRAVAAAKDIAERSQTIAARTAACVSSMQIADRTSQRLDHVRHALALLAVMAAGETHEDWDERRKRALIAAACELQTRQFDRAIEEFTAEVERFRNDLIGLADEVAAIAAEASAVFGGDSGALFIREVHAQAEQEMHLLERYTCSRGQALELVSNLISELHRMSADMEAVLNIDAEMRVIGLNASFKCGRLGSTGRALSVIAQELRACSHRTEETSRSVVEAMRETVALAEWLSEAVDEEREEATSLTSSLSSSVGSLARLSDTVGSGFQAVLKEWDGIAATLADAGGGIVLHRESAAIAGRISADLRELATEGAQMTLEYDLDEDLLRLLGQHYTMDSERAVHGSVADATTGLPSPDENLFFF